MTAIDMKMPECCKACQLEYFDGMAIYCAFSGKRTECCRDDERLPDCPLHDIANDEGKVM